MTAKIRDTVIQDGMSITGNMLNGGRVEIFGLVEGNLGAKSVLIHETGALYGKLQADNAEISGTLKGEASIRQLLSISSSGAVVGTVRYGQLAMAPGGNLDADVKNIPPELYGDFDLTVELGRSVVITTHDLTARDPDDLAQDLTFTISNARHGHVSLSGALSNPVRQFTQADLLAGKVSFVHGGANAAAAGFDVTVADDDGASSGAPRTVNVNVRSSA